MPSSTDRLRPTTAMHRSHTITRRDFLRRSGLLATATGLGRLGLINAHAQTAAPDYKVLVCVFLLGGNDAHNMGVQLNGPEYAAFKSVRGSLALPDGNTQLLQVSARDGRPYGLNSGLAAIHPSWAQGKLAVM